MQGGPEKVSQELIKALKILDYESIMNSLNDPLVNNNLDLVFYTLSYLLAETSNPNIADFEKFTQVLNTSREIFDKVLNEHITNNYSEKFNLEENPLSDAPIPKIIHLVWLGETFPESSRDDLFKLCIAAKRSGYKIMLWTDNMTKQDKLFEDMRAFPKSILNIKNISELLEKAQLDPDFQQRVKEYGNNKKADVIARLVAEEMSGSRNLAAASDYLRLLALKYFGGVYKDHDDKVVGNIEKLSIGDICLPFGFAVSNVFFESQWELKEPNADHDKFDNMNNSLIATQPNHPLLTMTLNQMLAVNALQERNILDKTAKSKEYTMSYKDKKRFGKEGSSEKWNFTIMIGPECLNRAADNLISCIAKKENQPLNTEFIKKGMFPTVTQSEIKAEGNHLVGRLHIECESAQTWMKESIKKRKAFEI